MVEGFALMFLELEEIDDAVKGCAGKVAAGVGKFGFQFGERVWMRIQCALEIALDIGGCGKWSGDLGGLAVVAEEWMQVAGVFGEDETDDVVLGKMRITAPFADEEGECIRVGIGTAGEELGVVQFDRDFESWLIGGGDGGEVRGVMEEMREEFDGGAGMFGGGFGAFVEAGEEFCAAFDADAITDVVSEDDVVARDDALGDELRERDKLLVGSGEEVVGVAREDELIAGMAVVEIDNAIQPWGKSGMRARSF